MGYLYAFVTIVFWALNIVLAKYFSANILPFQLSLSRWLVAAIVILPFSAKELWRLRYEIKQHFMYFCGVAILGVVFANTILYFAAETLTPTDVGLLQITSPLFLTILSVIFLKDTLNYKQVIGICIAIIGVFEVLLKGKWESLGQMKFGVGDLYMLMFSVSFAAYSLLQKKRPKEFSQVGLLAITIILGALILLPITYYSEGIPRLDKKDLEFVAYLGICNSVIAFLFWNIALSKLGDIKTSMFFYLMPFMISILSYMIFGSKLTSFEIYGGALIIFGILIMNFSATRKIE
ncbi:MAG: DMT family transporter [Alphaproteobacteria bacterium]